MPRLPLVLTLQFFMGEWNKSGDLWACVQPHVIDDAGFSSLPLWMAQPDGTDPKAADFDYSMAIYDQQTANASQPKVPLPLAEDVNLTIDFLDGGPPVTVDRINRLKILDPKKLASLNQAVSQDPSDTQVTVNPPANTPFATAYNQGVRASFASAMAKGAKAAGMANVLQLALWGGTREVFTADSVSMSPADPGLMVLPDVGIAGQTVTNLHSALGLLVRLGNRRTDLARLRAITDLRVVLHSGATPDQGVVWQTRLSATAGGPGVPAFFQSLSDHDMDSTKLAFAWNSVISKRAYARPAQTAFQLRTYGSLVVFERRVGAAVANNHPMLLMRKAVVTLKLPVASPPPNSLSIRPYRVIEGKIERYRLAPAGTSDAPIKTVLRFTPVQPDRSDFETLLDKDPDLFAGTGARVNIFADGAVQTYDSIGRWKFPWDQDADAQSSTLLFHGLAPRNAAAAILIEPARGALAFKVQQDPNSLQPNTMRWTGAPTPVDQAYQGFDGFFLDGLTSVSSAVLVGAEFSGDYDFDIAQSAGMIEAVGVSVCPHAMPANPQSTSAAGDYLNDLTNYNALNLYADGTPLNAPVNGQGVHTELYPIYKQTDPVPGSSNSTISHAFHFRYLLPTLRPSDDDIGRARSFYDSLYGAMGQPRSLTAGLEHTFGVELTSAAGAAIPRFADFPVQPPSSMIRATPDTARDPVTDVPFLAADYPNATTNETISISVNTPLLATKWASGKSTLGPHLAAWRAVAELAYADKIELQLGCYDFDVFTAAKKGGELANGLVPVALFAAPIDLTATLKSAARNWLNGQFDETNPTTFTVPLSPSKPIWQEAYVLALSLIVTRPPASVPQRAAVDWDLRGLPSPPAANQQAPADLNGLITPPAPDDAQSPFGDWLSALKSRTFSLATPPATDKLDAAFRAALQADANGTAPGSGNSGELAAPMWIYLRGTPDPWPGNAVVTVCPFGFRPLQLNRWFGPLTDQLISRYLQLLQSVLQLAVPWWADKSPSDWRAQFNTIAGLVDPNTGAPLLKLIDRMLSLLYPMPNQNRAGIPVDIIADAKNLADITSGPYKRCAGMVNRMLLNDISTFANARGFLHIHAYSQTGPLPRDFFSMTSEKQIGVEAQNGGTMAKRVDRVALTYRAAELDDAATGLEFVELLQETKYDDDFSYSSFELRRFQYLLNLINDPTFVPQPNSGNAYTIDHQVLLPGGTLAGNGKPWVYLAARAPVVKPAHLFTGRISQCQTADQYAAAFAPGTKYDYAAAKRGEFVPPTAGQPYLTVLYQTPACPRSDKLCDVYSLSGLFVVSGNEEIEDENDPLQGFELDSFYMDILADDPAVDDSKGTQPDPRTFALYKQLADVTDSATLLVAPATGSNPTCADDALSLALLSDTTNWITTPDVTNETTPDAPFAWFNKDQFVVSWEGNEKATWVAEAVILQVADPTKPKGGAPSFILLANREIEVWRTDRLGLVQTRNIVKYAGPEEDFAREFGQVSQEASDSINFQPVVEVPLRTDPRAPSVLSLNTRSVTLQDLVTGALSGMLSPDAIGGPSPFWLASDLVVTVNHDQQLPIAASWYDPDAGNATTPAEREFGASASSFPLQAYRVAKATGNDPKVQISFPAPYVHFRVDFQWTSDTNLPFFRLSDVAVEIVDGS